LAIKANNLNYSKIGEWILRNYELDKKRGSKPFERYVYKALDIQNVQKIVFSVSFDKKEAIKEVKQVFKKSKELKKIEEKRLKQLLSASIKINKLEINFAYLSAKNSLNSLIVLGESSEARRSMKMNEVHRPKNNVPIGIYAGLPWFFQFWSRDELISLGSLDTRAEQSEAKREDEQSSSPKKIQKIILLKHFNNLDKIYNLDSLGWLFYRAGKMITDREINKLFFKFIDKFEILDANLTWMDTLSRPKGIELYALKLASYKLAYQHSGNIKFLEKEKKLLKYTRDNFWNGKVLADMPNNFIIRPNIFLAAYIYLELLSKKEWIICFENFLSRLWLDWGGIATVDKTSDLFIRQSTGEDPKSYHNGDSWFWINNLAALVLSRLDKKRFKKYIKKILETSTNEILWNGTIGHHAEISSANKFISEGCWAQSWSNALYLELINYLWRS
jgi:glycogen debranching enzyme